MNLRTWLKTARFIFLFFIYQTSFARGKADLIVYLVYTNTDCGNCSLYLKSLSKQLENENISYSYVTNSNTNEVENSEIEFYRKSKAKVERIDEIRNKYLFLENGILVFYKDTLLLNKNAKSFLKDNNLFQLHWLNLVELRVESNPFISNKEMHIGTSEFCSPIIRDDNLYFYNIESSELIEKNSQKETIRTWNINNHFIQKQTVELFSISDDYIRSLDLEVFEISRVLKLNNGFVAFGTFKDTVHKNNYGIKVKTSCFAFKLDDSCRILDHQVFPENFSVFTEFLDNYSDSNTHLYYEFMNSSGIINYDLEMMDYKIVNEETYSGEEIHFPIKSGKGIMYNSGSGKVYDINLRKVIDLKKSVGLQDIDPLLKRKKTNHFIFISKIDKYFISTMPFDSENIEMCIYNSSGFKIYKWKVAFKKPANTFIFYNNVKNEIYLINYVTLEMYRII